MNIATPDNNALYLEASTAAQRGDHERAQTLYEKLERTAGAPCLRALVANDLGTMAAARGDLAVAQRQFEAALEFDPDCATAHANLERLQARDTVAGSSATDLDGDKGAKVALLSFLFNWPSTGGGIIHTVELAQFLSRAGHSVQLIYPQFADWGIGNVDETCPISGRGLEFDAAGEETALVDARGNRNSFTYDAASQKTVQIDPLNRLTTFGYDSAGNRTTRIDARTNRTTFTFDAKRQLTERRYPDGSRATFAYDSIGNRTTMQDHTGVYTTTFDAVSRKSTVTNPAGKNISYAYDAAGNRDHMIDPDAGRFTYSYDATGQTNHLMNPQGHRTSYSYDSAGRRTVKKLANGTRASFTFDAANQLTKLYNLDSDSTLISSFDYEYDDVGNRTNVVESNGDRVTWTYDDTYQLTAENRSGTNAYSNTFSYDAIGNRLVQNADGTRTTTVFDGANQIDYSIDAAGRTTYTFDADGNQQLVLGPNGDTTTNTWDYENRNTKIILATNTINTFVYEADGLRVEKQDSTGTTRFIWDNQKYLLETDDSNITMAVYTNEPNLYGTLTSQRRGDTTNWYHFDAIGSTRQLTDSSQAVTDDYVYSAFGTSVAMTGATINLFRYAGRFGYYLDSDSELYYVFARTYQPSIIRWQSVDPRGIFDEFNRFFTDFNGCFQHGLSFSFPQKNRMRVR